MQKTAYLKRASHEVALKGLMQFFLQANGKSYSNEKGLKGKHHHLKKRLMTSSGNSL